MKLAELFDSSFNFPLAFRYGAATSIAFRTGVGLPLLQKEQELEDFPTLLAVVYDFLPISFSGGFH